MKQRQFIAAIAGSMGSLMPAFAKRTKQPVIGYLAVRAPLPIDDVFFQELRPRRRYPVAQLVRTATLVLSAFTFQPTLAAAQTSASPEGSSVHFALVGADGATISEQSYRGKWLAIYFGYTYCPDICPTTMMDIAGALKVLGQRSSDVQGIFVTVDPQRDKPEILREYLRSFDPRFVGLTGTPAQISAAAKSFHVFYERNDADDGNYTYDHSTSIYLVDPNGKLAKTITDEGGSKAIADDLLALMTVGR